MTTETLRPNAAGDLTQCTPFGAVNNWDCVDETPSDEDTTHVGHDGLDGVSRHDLYNLPATSIPAGSTINSVMVYNRSCTIILGKGSGRTKIKTNGVVYDGETYAPPTSYGDFSTVYANNPQSGVAWTIEEINALQIGVRCVPVLYLGEYMSILCTQVYVVIDYTEAVAPPVVKKPIWECITRGGQKQERARFHPTLKLKLLKISVES